MKAADRRMVLQMATLGAFLAGLAGAGARAASAIAPPVGPLRFRRTVHRELSGGARIVVMREFQIVFRPIASGFVVEGRQIAVRADFPAGLERFAELETARADESTFPLVLDASGLIASLSQQAPADILLQAAIGEAMALIRAQPLAPEDRQGLLRYVETLHQAGSSIIAQMPPDLFAPRELAQVETRRLALPAGGSGQVSSRFFAERDAATALVSQAWREIRTEIGGETRITREEWALAPA